MSGTVLAHASAFALAALFSLAITPLATRFAWVVGWLDHPEARKLHTSATALLGGVAVACSATLAWIVASKLAPSLSAWFATGGPAATEFLPPRVGLLAGAGLVLALGMWDDRFGMLPRPKLLAQAVAGAVMISSIGVPDLGWPTSITFGLALLATISLMNAINFLDNMNGMLGGIVSISLLGFAAILGVGGDVPAVPAVLAVAGALVGFLPSNFPRARIFLGDAGSLLLGYSLAASLLLALQVVPRGWAQFGPPLLVAYPAFDMTFVVICRVREGRPIDQGGRDHSNHRLASLLQCPIRTVLLIWCSTAALCASGFALSRVARPALTLPLWGLWIILFLLMGRRLSSVPIAPKA